MLIIVSLFSPYEIKLYLLFTVASALICLTGWVEMRRKGEKHSFKATKLLHTLKDLPERGVGCWQP